VIFASEYHPLLGTPERRHSTIRRCCRRQPRSPPAVGRANTRRYGAQGTNSPAPAHTRYIERRRHLPPDPLEAARSCTCNDVIAGGVSLVDHRPPTSSPQPKSSGPAPNCRSGALVRSETVSYDATEAPSRIRAPNASSACTGAVPYRHLVALARITIGSRSPVHVRLAEPRRHCTTWMTVIVAAGRLCDGPAGWRSSVGVPSVGGGAGFCAPRHVSDLVSARWTLCGRR
jgi:hypothetical protein